MDIGLNTAHIVWRVEGGTLCLSSRVCTAFVLSVFAQGWQAESTQLDICFCAKNLTAPYSSCDRTGLDFAFLLMGSGFSYPAFLHVLRHYVTIGEPHAKSASAADSASTAMSFLVDHAMAVADPHYRPPPFDPSYASAPASDRPMSSEYLSSQDNKSLSGPLAAPSLYISQQEHEWVAGPNGIGHLISRGSASNRRRLGPGDLASQGEM
jgi:hypothetical protein